MKSSLRANAISSRDVDDYIGRYAKYVPSGLQGLDELRYNEVPKVLNQRTKDGEPFLEKTEVTGLVEWKLYHLSTQV